MVFHIKSLEDIFYFFLLPHNILLTMKPYKFYMRKVSVSETAGFSTNLYPISPGHN